MKCKVEYNTLSWVLTMGITVGLVVGLIASWAEPEVFYIILGIILLLYIPSLFFAPVSLSANSDMI